MYSVHKQNESAQVIKTVVYFQPTFLNEKGKKTCYIQDRKKFAHKLYSVIPC